MFRWFSTWPDASGRRPTNRCQPLSRAALQSLMSPACSALAAQAAIASRPADRQKEKPCTCPNQARTSIHYALDFKASPEKFYQAIVDAKQFADFSGMPATIDATQGGAFSMFGGLIQGRNIELVPKPAHRAGLAPRFMGSGSLFHRPFRIQSGRLRNKPHV